MSDLDQRIHVIEERNRRVAADKAWEVSWTRRGLIAGITYVSALILLNILGNERAWKHACIPVMGYLLSTFSLPPIKKMWIAQKERKNAS